MTFYLLAKFSHGPSNCLRLLEIVHVVKSFSMSVVMSPLNLGIEAVHLVSTPEGGVGKGVRLRRGEWGSANYVRTQKSGVGGQTPIILVHAVVRPSIGNS